MYSAHFDHLGINPAQAGDNIYNGAIDNATGDAMLLEVARGLTLAPAPPRRFTLRRWMRRSRVCSARSYLAGHPPLPVKDIALNLNFEGIFIMPAGIPEQLMVSGAERTSFLPEVAGVAKAFGMEIVPDPLPLGVLLPVGSFCVRADGDSGVFNRGRQQVSGPRPRLRAGVCGPDYIAHRYHQPADEYSDKFDLRANARLAQLAIALGWRGHVVEQADCVERGG